MVQDAVVAECDLPKPYKVAISLSRQTTQPSTAAFFLRNVQLFHWPCQTGSLNSFIGDIRVINLTKTLACSYVYWPNGNKQLESLAHNCSNCQLAPKSPRNSTLFSWSRFHIDFSELINAQISLVLVHSYSKWPKIITSEETILRLQQILGIPEILLFFNGTTFPSLKFTRSRKYWKNML